MKRRNSVDSFSKCAIGCALAALVVGSSCATRGDLMSFREEMQAHSTRTEFRLSEMESSLALIDSLVREQSRTTQSLRALIGTQTQEQRDDIAMLMARQDDINYQLRELMDTLQAIQLYGGLDTAMPGAANQQQDQSLIPRQSSPALQQRLLQLQQQQAAQTPQPATPQTTIQEEPEPTDSRALQQYESALTDLRDGNYLLAESLFLSFLMQFPSHEMADDAQYWLGEAAYGQEKYDLAINEFRKVIDKYSDSDRIPVALLRIGSIQMEQGNRKDGADTLNRLIATHPETDEATRARELLNRP